MVTSPRARIHLLLPLLFLLTVAPVGAAPLGPGDRAPRFTFSDIQTGETKGFADVAGNGPLLLVFLQTACRSCVREMVALKTVYAEVEGFGVLGVFLDLKPRGLEKYVADYELPFTFTWDGSYATADAYGVSFSPTSFLVGSDGKVAAVYAGFTLGTEDDVRADLEKLLVRR
ncbi:MAG TPA: redoxin domain-containing protein [Deferrisomatales bacterium]|nr:redoxin domain-containing protein [Deferrisomatales bacterium]